MCMVYGSDSLSQDIFLAAMTSHKWEGKKMSNLVGLSCVDRQGSHEQKAGIQRFEHVESTSKHWNRLYFNPIN